ncbi:MAG: hypothetical protein WA765_07150 [Candidatus Acidiferrum sp.]
MRVVVADATPLHYLILIGAIQALPRIFEKISVPIEVRDELSCDATRPDEDGNRLKEASCAMRE